MAKMGAPVQFEVNAMEPEGQPVQLRVSKLPAGASFHADTGRFEWTPDRTQTGKYPITITAVNAAGQTTSAETTIDVGSGVPSLEAVERGCSPGAIASLTGSWLAAAGTNLSDPSGKAMDLGGTKVIMNGAIVPVLIASSDEVRFLCPVLEPETQLQVTVETAVGSSGALGMVMQSASPWIFALDEGDTQGVVSFTGRTELAMIRNARKAAQPAQPGDEVVIWGSGFGGGGQVSVRTVSVQVGGGEAEVVSVDAVPGYAGVYTVRVRVPSPITYGDGVPLQVKVIGVDGKEFKSNNITVAVERAAQ
jgi:uncharacterized protein (TIGR03437 family)